MTKQSAVGSRQSAGETADRLPPTADRRLPTELIADLLTRGHSVRFQARGDSMHPIIRDEDYLHIVPHDGSPITRGDVVLTLSERGLTVHRVVDIDGDVIITRGDNAAAPDPSLHSSRILGRVSYVERDGAQQRMDRLSPVALAARRFTIRLRDWQGR